MCDRYQYYNITRDIMYEVMKTTVSDISSCKVSGCGWVGVVNWLLLSGATEWSVYEWYWGGVARGGVSAWSQTEDNWRIE